MTNSKPEQAYAADHSAAVIAAHSARNVAIAAEYLLKPLRESYGDSREARLRFLDVGCGPGSITIDFAGNYYPKSYFTAIDYTDAPISQAREAAKKAGVANVEFAVGDVHDIQFPDNTFDVVYCHQVLMHIADPIKALSEMRRVCKSGGIVGAKEACGALWYPQLPGMQTSWDLFQAVSKSRGGNPYPGHYIHVWARQAGFARDHITCSVDTSLYASAEERHFWGGTWVKRMDPDSGADYVEHALKGGFTTREGLQAIIADYQRWIDDEDGWYCTYQGEIVCRKVQD